eukprot:TRINITY_DN11082_c0_g3_i1.p1 TRINITY_DN11082_c0_g3~~TRINITY_DN11082_c0_g3_i1.p1  ORF type:complete len:523 (+),score=121.70 TRINITY_DN11082_c0_g3_i1:102-1670(+)
MQRVRKRDRFARWALENWKRASKTAGVLSSCLVVVALFSIYWNGFRSFVLPTFSLWLVAQAFSLALSVYIARRYVFFSKPTSQVASSNKLRLVMVRRLEDVRTRSCKPPQVLRWDFFGVFFSNLFGKVSRLPLPVFLRSPLYHLWGYLFSARLEESKHPLSFYRCLQEFFTRPLKEGVRPLDACDLVSPVDGRVVVAGVVDQDRVEQVKGVTYSLSQFLGEDVTNKIPTITSPRLITPASNNFPLPDSTPQSQFLNYRGETEQKSKTMTEDDDTQSEVFSVGENDVDEEVEVEMLDNGDDEDTEGEVNRENEALKQIRQNAAPGSPTAPTRALEAGSAKVAPPQAVKTRLYHMVIYLAPGDYHRIHAPCGVTVDHVRHFPGTLFPISPLVARLIPNLFALNERVVLSGSWKFGYFSLTAVGAYNVGSISLNFDSQIRTNRLRRDFRNPNLEWLSFGGLGCYAYDRVYEQQIRLAQGEELGRFNLGSTVVLVFEAPEDFEFTVKGGEKIKLGQRLGTSKSAGC